MRIGPRDVDWWRIGVLLLVAVAVVGVVVAFSAMSATMSDMRDAAQERQAALDELTDQYTALYEQAIVEGVEPDTASPDEVREKSPDPIPGPRGERGAPGADSTVPGPQGPPGRPGRDGEDSTVPGPPGSDSTVPGPPGT